MFKRGPRPQVGETVELGGLSATVVSDEEAETCHIVVCGPRSCFPDDVRTTCSRCGATVFHRPYAPKTPPKIGIACLFALAQASEAS